jgi:hypothetical protein
MFHHIKLNRRCEVKYLNCSCTLQLAWLIYTIFCHWPGLPTSSYVWLVHDLSRPLSVLLLVEINELDRFSYLKRKHDLLEVLIST